MIFYEFFRDNVESKQKADSNIDYLTKDNKKSELDKEKEKKQNDKISTPIDSEYSESFRQLQQELLNDNIEYIIDDRSKKDSKTDLIGNDS